MLTQVNKSFFDPLKLKTWDKLVMYQASNQVSNNNKFKNDEKGSSASSYDDAAKNAYKTIADKISYAIYNSLK